MCADFTRTTPTCGSCGEPSTNNKKCQRCKKKICGECRSNHPQVLLPHMGMRIKQTLCPACFAVICSKKSDFIIRDKQGHIYSTGEQLPTGLINYSSDTDLHVGNSPTQSFESPRFLSNEEIINLKLPQLRIIIILVGSRGDVQPYIAFSKKLIEEGHRVRIATHEHHRNFVEKYKIEFFPIAGDPAELMEFMVENQLNSMQGFTNKITKHRQWVQELCKTSWAACTTSLDGKQYRSDVIVANPPSFVGFHIAEKLAIPLIISFTMPWTATSEFSSPFVRTTGPKKNFLSYMLVDRGIWLGIRGIINKWREDDLHLPPVRTKNFRGHRIIYDLKVPHIYCFSEKLLPRPKDWGNWIGVAGFYFLDTKTDWEPPEELVKFLDAGEPPIFVGFGSIVVADPMKLTNCVMDAIELAGCRAIVQEGWAKIKPQQVPDNVLLIGPAPHDWLFERCAAVVHHGGAGTTATGLRAGKPTVVVPFFGDQFFWGDTIARMQLGPRPVLHSTITPEALGKAIKFALTDDIKENARQCGVEIQEERGVEKGVHLFKKFLPVDNMWCSICPKFVAEVFCKSCDMVFCKTCNSVIHLNVPGYLDHEQFSHKLKNWQKHSDWWGSYANAIADGGSVFSNDLGSGVVAAVNQVSEAQGVAGVVSGLGKAVLSVASGIVTGTGNGISTTLRVAREPTYGSPTMTPPRESYHLSSAPDQLPVEQITILDTFKKKINYQGDEHTCWTNFTSLSSMIDGVNEQSNDEHSSTCSE